MKELTAKATIRRTRIGVMPFPRGDYSSTTTDYYWNDNKRDMVYYNKYWYAVKKFDPFNPVPKGSIPSGTSVYWELVSQFSVLYAGCILTEHLGAGAITVRMLEDAINDEAFNINDGNMIIYGDGSIDIKKSGRIRLFDAKGNFCTFQNGKLTGHSAAVIDGLNIVSDWNLNLPVVYNDPSAFLTSLELITQMSANGATATSSTIIQPNSIELGYTGENGATKKVTINAQYGLQKS